jgi:hypothetical protein
MIRPSLLPAARALAFLSGLVLLGCKDLDSFDSKPGQAYCGTIGSPVFQDGFTVQDMPPSLQLALTLDMGKLASEPGRLSSNDAQSGLCNPQALFEDQPLRAIPEVDRDVISALTFGEGHEHDFFAWVDSSCQGTMLAVVSLMKNSQVELRLFKPMAAPAVDAPPQKRPGFAVFHLTPQARTLAECGF